MAQSSGNPLTVDFKGSILVNAVPAMLEGGNRHIDTVGGIIWSENTQTAYFGRVVSVDPAEPNLFMIGWAAGKRVVGVILNEQGIRENDPAKPDYILNELPATAVIEGALWFASWKTGAGLKTIPQIGDKVIFDDVTGEIAFLPDGTPSPAGFHELFAAVVKTDFLANGVCVTFKPQTFAVIPTEDLT